MAGFGFAVFMVCLSAAFQAADCNSYTGTPFTQNILQSLDKELGYINHLSGSCGAALGCTLGDRDFSYTVIEFEPMSF
jgi:hypothetical protein